MCASVSVCEGKFFGHCDNDNAAGETKQKADKNASRKLNKAKGTRRSPGYCFSLSYSHKVARERERERHRERQRQSQISGAWGEVNAHIVCAKEFKQMLSAARLTVAHLGQLSRVREG